MTKQIFIIPAEGATILNPKTGVPLPKEGEFVEDTSYIRRRIEDETAKVGEPPKGKAAK